MSFFHLLSSVIRFEFKKLGFLAASVLLVGCRPNGERTEPSAVTEAVNISQTAGRDQGSIGFCWSYAIMGLLEGEYKARTGKSLVLSPEAIGAVRLVQSFKYLFVDAIHAKENGESIEKIEADIGERFRSLSSLTSKKEREEKWELNQAEYVNQALVFIEKYGLIPESAWKEKFSTEEELIQKVFLVKQGFFQLLRKSAKVPTDDEILKSVVSVAFQNQIPFEDFEFEGKRFTAKSFASDVVGFKKSNFQHRFVSSQEELESALQDIKKSLISGHGAVVNINMDREQPLEGTHRYRGTSIGSISNHFPHVVLVTDFVNQGGQPGFQPGTDLKKEASKSLNELDYIVAINSWGGAASEGQKGSVYRGNLELEAAYLTADFIGTPASASNPITSIREVLLMGPSAARP
jgi:hypothetical protein